MYKWVQNIFWFQIDHNTVKLKIHHCKSYLQKLLALSPYPPPTAASIEVNYYLSAKNVAL